MPYAPRQMRRAIALAALQTADHNGPGDVICGRGGAAWNDSAVAIVAQGRCGRRVCLTHDSLSHGERPRLSAALRHRSGVTGLAAADPVLVA